MSFIFSNPLSPQAKVQNPPIVAQTPPPTSGPQAQQYPIGTFWIDTSSDVVYTLTSFANGQANWVSQISGGGTFSSLSVDPGPTSITGEFRVDANIDEAEVIRLRENGGASGTIEIASLQGTGADAIKIQSVAGGVQILTDAAAGDIQIESSLGSVTIESGENNVAAIFLQTSGGAAATMTLSNTTGTDPDAIKISAPLGGLDIDIAAFTLNTTGAMDIVAGTDLTLEAAAGDAILRGFDTVQLEGQGAFSNAILLDATNLAGGIDVNAGTSGVDVDTTGGITLDAARASNFTITGNFDLSMGTSGGSVNITAGEPVADAIVISPTGANAGIKIAPAATVGSVEIGNEVPTVNRTTTIGGGTVATAVTDAINIGTGATTANGAAFKTINIGTGVNDTGSTSVAIATGNCASGSSTVSISTGTGGGTKTVSIGNVAGGTTITELGTVAINSTGAGTTTIGSTATGGAVAINSASTITELGTVNINTSGSGATTVGNAGAGGAIALTTNTAVGIDAKTASHFTITGAADLTLNSTAGSMVITGGEAAVDAVQINASNAAGGVDVNVGTGGITVDTTGAMSFDSAAASNMTVTGAFDLTVNSTAGSVVMTGGEAAVDAIDINASNAAGGIDIDSGTGGITLDSTGLMSLDAAGAANFTTTGAFDLTLNSTAGSVIVQGGEAVNDAVKIYASDPLGGVLIQGSTIGNVSVANNQVAGAAGPNPTVATTNNARVGSITYAGYTQAASATLVITLTNSFITATSAIIACATNVGANDAQMHVTRIKPAAGSAEITILNSGAAALNGNMLLTFWVLS